MGLGREAPMIFWFYQWTNHFTRCEWFNAKATACSASTVFPSMPVNPHEFLSTDDFKNNSQVVPYWPGCVILTHVAKTHSAWQSGISSSPRFMTEFHSWYIISFLGVLSLLPGQQEVKLEKGCFLSGICPSLLELPCHVLEIYFPLIQRTAWFYGKEQQKDCTSLLGLWKGSLGLLRLSPSACWGLWFESL